jgi:hypothetical protein
MPDQYYARSEKLDFANSINNHVTSRKVGPPAKELTDYVKDTVPVEITLLIEA